MSPSLSVVADRDLKPTTPKTETVGERVRRLQAEAKQLAKDHVRTMSADMIAIAETAAEIADGGDAYPPGIRELAARLVDEIDARVHTLEALISRNF